MISMQQVDQIVAILSGASQSEQRDALRAVAIKLGLEDAGGGLDDDDDDDDDLHIGGPVL